MLTKTIGAGPELLQWTQTCWRSQLFSDQVPLSDDFSDLSSARSVSSLPSSAPHHPAQRPSSPAQHNPSTRPSGAGLHTSTIRRRSHRRRYVSARQKLKATLDLWAENKWTFNLFLQEYLKKDNHDLVLGRGSALAAGGSSLVGYQIQKVYYFTENTPVRSY